MKTIDDLIKDANSVLNTLDKDYAAMQSQKSDVRQDQTEVFNGLCEDMNSILLKYAKTIYDFSSKTDRCHDSTGTEFTVYEYPDPDKLLVIVPELYWTAGREGKPTYKLNVHEKPKKGNGHYSSAYIVISETGIEAYSSGFGDDGYSDLVSVFLNHRPTYEQLDTAFQTALADFIQFCVTCIQKRNENLADKIKAITL